MGKGQGGEEEVSFCKFVELPQHGESLLAFGYFKRQGPKKRVNEDSQYRRLHDPARRLRRQ